MKKLSAWINTISTGWVTLIALVIFLLFTATVLPYQAERADVYSGEVSSPDTSFYYSADTLYQFAGAYGPEGRNAYIRARLTFDLIWPVIYLAFLATSISWAFKKAGRSGDFWARLNLLPVLALLLDYLENASTVVVMTRYPDPTPLLASLAGIFTALKWVFIGGSFVILAVGLGLAGWRRVSPGVRD